MKNLKEFNSIELTLEDKSNTNGGSIIAAAILTVALFSAGYQVGRDLAS
ncbi:hypothetical protein [Aquimarina algicola]|nr:hypothetical protein [Aquimarina algicola]